LLQSDGQSCEATFFGTEKDYIHPLVHHTFGSPCFGLDSHLQSGVGGAPKWDPQSHLGIYVGHSPSHAGSVVLVLNPWTGHVSLQFHEVFDDHFTTVPYMEKNEVPPHWSHLVEKSREKVTEEHYDLAKTWLFPDAELGDISMLERNPNVLHNPNGALIEQEVLSNAVSQNLLPADNLSKTQVGQVSTIEAHGISQNEDFLHSSLLHSASSSENRDTFPHKSDDSPLVPSLINLETSGLRGSPQLASQNGTTNNGPAVAAYTSSTRQLQSRWITRPKPKLSFLPVFNSVGIRWTFATLIPHSENEQISFVAKFANDFERNNSLFDDMINEICHQVQAYATSNESYTYSQMLCEADHINVFEATEIEINDNESCRHWTLILCKELPIGAKTIMAIWSFSKRFPDGTLNKHKA
jgi:hypothetical protein